jgi:hypothetical protein
VNINDFFDYLLGRDATRDLAVELVSAYQFRTPGRTTRSAETRG